jgi:hypothetical protein
MLPGHFALVILEMGVSGTICLGWSQTIIFLISASQVVRIIDVSYWCSVQPPFLLPAPRTLRNLRLRLISRPTCNCLYNRLHQRLLANPARWGMLCGGAQPGVQGPCQV